mgnify:CR=1 FL=1
MDVGGLLGNEAIRARLDAAAAQDRFSHSYLICGPDGSGKHTLAKILAAAAQTKHISYYHHGMTTGLGLMHRRDRDDTDWTQKK